MRLILVKQLNNTFKVAYDSDYEKLKRIKAGKLLDCKITQPRNVEFHRKFFALITLVYQNQEVYKNMDYLRRDLTKAAGFYESWFDYEGVEQVRAKSISFSSMSADEFKELYNRVLDKIVEIYNWEKQEIKDQLKDFM